MVHTTADVKRIIDSLALLGQESAENGGMPSEIYADLFEAIRMLTELIKEVQAA
ncbi:MAG: hypothetical protein ACI4F7_08875 [Acutalibacteraceae bacterium]|jgi:hypothetical protein